MSGNRMRLWFSLFVIAVFAVGLTSGVLIGRTIARRALIERALDRPGRGPGEFGPGGPGRRGGGPRQRVLVERLTSDLDLTAEQQKKIEGILTESRGRVETLQRDVREKFDAEQRSLRDAIRQVLTPEQQQKFDQRERQRGRFGRRGPPR
jgi:Spy/CpxP family protein refolding chaperone